jgi:hypothetical protein
VRLTITSDGELEAALELARRAAAAVGRGESQLDEELVNVNPATVLADAFTALDEWMSAPRDGCPPEAWRGHQQYEADRPGRWRGRGRRGRSR